MASFEEALPWVLSHEGGWSNDPADPGGATNYGITLATAQKHGIPDAEALKIITPEQVAAIYRSGYWCFSGLVNQAVSTKLLDMAVNLGPYAAIRIVQDVLNAMGADLAEDGHWGSKTEAAANAAPADRLLDHLCRDLADYYLNLASRRPASGKFLKGWLRRAEDRP